MARTSRIKDQELAIGERMKRGIQGLLILSIFVSSSLTTYGQIFDGIGKLIFPPEKQHFDPETTKKITNASPIPDKYHMGWIVDYLNKIGIPNPDVLHFPTGTDQIIRRTANHPIVKEGVRRSFERLLKSPKNQAVPLGEFLKQIRRDIDELTPVFPEKYTQSEITQYKNDVMFLIAGATQHQFLKNRDAKNIYGVDPKLLEGTDDNAPINFGGDLLDRQPRVYPSPIEACYSLRDALYRCLGHDRAQHVLAHALKTLWQSDYIDSKNPKLRQGLVADPIIQIIDLLDVSKEEKLQIFTDVIGGGWEVLENILPLVDNLKRRTPLEMSLLPFQAIYVIETVRDEVVTGATEPIVTNDYDANKLGTTLIIRFRGAHSEDDVQKIIKDIDSDPYITGNGGVFKYGPDSYQSQLSQRLKILYILGEIVSQNEKALSEKLLAPKRFELTR